MKTVALVVLSLFLSKSCQSKKDTVEMAQSADSVKTEEVKTASNEDTTQENTMIEYEALSRGFYKKIIFQNNQLTVISDRDSQGKGDMVKLSKEDLSEISNLLKGINPEELPNLKAPTEKRMYDGAAHANLTITTKGKTYAGSGFDHGFPPKAIEKLVNKLVSFSEEK